MKNGSNHEITIIGWDDNYSDTGAYIALNSWGSEWGYDGVFYISYEDIWVEEFMSGITDASSELDESRLDAIKIEDNLIYESVKEQIGYTYANDNEQTIYVTPLQKEYVQQLDFSDITGIKTLKGIENFENCTWIVMNNCKLESLECIEPIADKISVLYATNNVINNIDTLSKCENIAILDLSGNTSLEDLSAICDLQNLTWLCLNDCNLTDISGLQNLTCDYVELEEVSVQVELANNDIKDVSVLKNANIQILNLSGNKNLTGIEELENVLNLNLSNCDLEDISFLKSLENLSILNIDDNKIKDISVLTEMGNLVSCSVKNQCIEDTIVTSELPYTYNAPSIIYLSEDMNYLIDEYDLESSLFESLNLDNAVITENTKITLSSYGTATITIIGGIADGTVYTIKCKSLDNTSDQENSDNVDSDSTDSQVKANTNQEDDTTATSSFPKTGQSITVLLIVVTLILASLQILRKSRKLNNILNNK